VHNVQIQPGKWYCVDSNAPHHVKAGPFDTQAEAASASSAMDQVLVGTNSVLWGDPIDED
jgi:hypothetical protein